MQGILVFKARKQSISSDNLLKRIMVDIYKKILEIMQQIKEIEKKNPYNPELNNLRQKLAILQRKQIHYLRNSFNYD